MVTSNGYKIFQILLTFLILNVTFVTPFVNFRKTETPQLGYVTFGSAIKITPLKTEQLLSSSDLTYGGRGSGQKVVTAGPSNRKVHWQVLSPTEGNKPGAKLPKRGEKVSCGTEILLKNAHFGCYLHSHNFEAPMSYHREVACHDGGWDSNSVFYLKCDGEFWERGKSFSLRHKAMGGYVNMKRNEAMKAFKKVKSHVHGSLRYSLLGINSQMEVVPRLERSRDYTHEELMDDITDTESRYIFYLYNYLSSDGRKCDKLFLIQWIPLNTNQTDRILYTQCLTQIKNRFEGVEVKAINTKRDMKRLLKKEVMNNGTRVCTTEESDSEFTSED